MNINSFIEECQNNGIFLFFNEKGNISYKNTIGRISKSTFEEITRYKPLLVNHFRGRKNTSFTGIKNTKNAKLHADSAVVSEEVNDDKSGGIELNQTGNSFSQGNLSFEVLVEEITRYRHVLEQTYRDADNDGWHNDGLPQKFRSQDHTYDEMKVALAKFIEHVHQREEKIEAASLAFRSARDALPDYQKYMKVLRVYNSSDPVSVEEVRFLWQSCLKAYENMPEQKAFMAAKKRQALFYHLVDKNPSGKYIQELINSLG